VGTARRRLCFFERAIMNKHHRRRIRHRLQKKAALEAIAAATETPAIPTQAAVEAAPIAFTRRSDLRLLRRAIVKSWPVAPEKRQEIIIECRRLAAAAGSPRLRQAAQSVLDAAAEHAWLSPIT
jgi:hypothetical protein